MFLPKITRRDIYKGEAGFHGYRRFKLEISDDCKYRCVYCDIREENLGGYEMMELDHFRPKKKTLFPELKNDPLNLLYSCRHCNNKKRDDWPAGKTDETHLSGLGYVDPFCDREEYFTIDEEGRMIFRKEPAQYIIDQLVLNRPLAVVYRKRLLLFLKMNKAAEKLEQEHGRLIESAGDLDRERLKEIIKMLGEIRVKIMEQILPSN